MNTEEAEWRFLGLRACVRGPSGFQHLRPNGYWGTRNIPGKGWFLNSDCRLGEGDRVIVEVPRDRLQPGDMCIQILTGTHEEVVGSLAVNHGKFLLTGLRSLFPRAPVSIPDSVEAVFGDSTLVLVHQCSYFE